MAAPDLLDLPADILIRIITMAWAMFRHANSVLEANNLMASCKQLRAACSSFIRTMSMTSPTPVECWPRGATLHRIVCRGSFNLGIIRGDTAAMFQHVTRVTIATRNVTSMASMVALAQACPLLSTLDMSFESLTKPDMLRGLASMQSLTNLMCYAKRHMPLSVMDSIDKIPKLKHLHVHFGSRPVNIVALFAACRNSAHAVYSLGCAPVSDPHTVAEPLPLPNLELLYLVALNPELDGELRTVDAMQFLQHTRLKTLCLTDFMGFECGLTEAFPTLLGLPNLKIMRLVDCVFYAPPGIKVSGINGVNMCVTNTYDSDYSWMLMLTPGTVKVLLMDVSAGADVGTITMDFDCASRVTRLVDFIRSVQVMKSRRACKTVLCVDPTVQDFQEICETIRAKLGHLGMVQVVHPTFDYFPVEFRFPGNVFSLVWEEGRQQSLVQRG